MSVISKAIYDSMQELQKSEENILSAYFNFGVSFVGFNGHFPSKPILPGMSIVQSIIVMYETFYSVKLRIVEIENAKFIAVVKNNEDIFFECSGSLLKEDEFVIRAKVLSGDKKVAVIKLRLMIEEKGESDETS